MILRENQNLTAVKISAPADMPNLLLYHKFAAFSNFDLPPRGLAAAMLQLICSSIKFDSWFAAAVAGL